MIVIKQVSGTGLVDVLVGNRVVAEGITLIEMLDLLEECVYRVMGATTFVKYPSTKEQIGIGDIAK